jgi:hypothetical protein
MPDYVSNRVRVYVRDMASGWTLREIDSLWTSEDFELVTVQTEGRQRITRWENYEAQVDWGSLPSVTRYIHVLEQVVSSYLGETSGGVLKRLLARDGWELDYRGMFVLASPPEEPLLELSGLSALRSPDGIQEAFARIRLLIDSDPAGTVGGVKELIEATAKTVLEHCNIDHGNDDLPALIRATQDALGLHAAAVRDDVDGSASIKKVLGGLSSIAVGLTELRNSDGSGHGRTRATRLTARHARLAVNASRAWCEIVLDTFADPDAPWRTQAENPTV